MPMHKNFKVPKKNYEHSSIKINNYYKTKLISIRKKKKENIHKTENGFVRVTIFLLLYPHAFRTICMPSK